MREQFIIIMESTNRGRFLPTDPGPLCREGLGSLQRAPQWAFLEAEKSVHREDVPSGKPPLRWGHPGHGTGVCHSKQRGEAIAQS